eukprot:CAMPEP_0175121292 /NCGR_PEP_ID=MMETSP0087-20121206/1089_1 /TAXON_ID=136419 /ORGANISM="Unknown Unknown, Strain D1" /LENGTH=206 /DNA_ID=CAMNT_0016402821 /DNA_START=130 /DNA_END=751 /DNA_ORIENTATION=-
MDKRRQKTTEGFRSAQTSQSLIEQDPLQQQINEQKLLLASKDKTIQELLQKLEETKATAASTAAAAVTATDKEHQLEQKLRRVETALQQAEQLLREERDKAKLLKVAHNRMQLAANPPDISSSTIAKHTRAQQQEVEDYKYQILYGDSVKDAEVSSLKAQHAQEIQALTHKFAADLESRSKQLLGRKVVGLEDWILGAGDVSYLAQ